MTRRRRFTGSVLAATVGVLALALPAAAHDGPPFPIVTEQNAGPYTVSLWTDPDTTDDGSAGGQFWVVLHQTADAPPPDGTMATVSISPADRAGTTRTGRTAPVDGNLTRQFVALVMDHEGPFKVHVSIDGPLGPAVVDADVQGTYDLRPSPWMLLVFMLPFVLVGVLWLKLLLRRRRRPA